MTSLGNFVIILLAAVGCCKCLTSVPQFTASSASSSSLDGLWKVDRNTSMNDVMKRWMKMERSLKDAVNQVFKLLGRSAIRLVYTADVSERCLQDLLRLSIGIQKLKPWAFRMLDASGKLSSGLGQGSLSSLGNYDQCLDTVVHTDTRSEMDPTAEELFKGQYCAINIIPHLPPKPQKYRIQGVLDEFKEIAKKDTVQAITARFAQLFYFLYFRLGICAPSTCDVDDISKILKVVSSDFNYNISLAWCEVKNDNIFTSAQIAIIVIFSITGLFLLLGTGLDIWQQQVKRKPQNLCCRLLLAFSIVTNTRKIFNTESNNTSLSCFHGIRVLSITWIILAHTYFNVNYQLLRDLYQLQEFTSDFAFQGISNASVAVDSFFFMSGFLVCNLTLTFLKKTKKQFSLKLFIFHRIWRLTPTHMAVIGFCIIAPSISSGPLWHETTDQLLKSCNIKWWANLLFINNFIPFNKMCLPQSWYIAADMQLYLLSLIVLIPLIRNKRIIGLSINFLLILLSAIIIALVTYFKGFPPTMLFAYPDPQHLKNYFINIYFMPYTHLGPYCIGIFLGYYLAMKNTVVLRPMVTIIGWAVAVTFNMSVLYGVLEWNKGAEFTFGSTLLYAALCRICWALGLSWVTLVCATGHGGIVNRILSWRGWIPLSRLTFIAYLVHPLAQLGVVGSFREEITASPQLPVWIYFGHLLASFSIAYAASLLVESPLLAIEKILLGPLEKEKSPDASDSSKENKKNDSDMNGKYCIKEECDSISENTRRL